MTKTQPTTTRKQLPIPLVAVLLLATLGAGVVMGPALPAISPSAKAGASTTV